MLKKVTGKGIVYTVYVLAVFLTLTLSIIDVLSLHVFAMLYMVLIFVFFMICCNIFYVPRQLDTLQMLENKNQMKTDLILWKPLVYLETPLLIAMLIIAII